MVCPHLRKQKLDELTISDLQRLEEIANEAENEDLKAPGETNVRLRHLLKRSMSLGSDTGKFLLHFLLCTLLIISGRCK